MDTPEVAHAKAAHLAAVAEAAAKVPHSAASYAENQDYHGYSKPISVGHQMYHSGYKYRGPPAPLDHEVKLFSRVNPPFAHCPLLTSLELSSLKVLSFFFVKFNF